MVCTVDALKKRVRVGAALANVRNVRRPHALIRAM